jgi:hypothetical protein
MKRSHALILGAFAVVGVAGYRLLDDLETIEPVHARTPVATTTTPARMTALPVAPSTRREPPAIAVPSEPPKEQARSSRELHEQLQSAFTSSAAGDTYSATAQLETTIRGTLPIGSTLRAVACHGPLCRVETTHTNADEFRAFVRATFDAPSKIPSGPAYVSIVETPASGPVVAVAFLSQSGTELPLN